MAKTNDGGGAYPLSITDFRDKDEHPQPGMSLRDYFAGQALAPLISMENGPEVSEVGMWCYRYADAMLAEREKGER